MKSHVAACTVLTLVCILLLYLPVHAQDFSTTELFPNYEVETLHKTDESKDMVFPFIHKGSLYAFSLAYRIPIWKIFIGGDLLSPYTVGEKIVYLYDIYNRIYAIDLHRGELFWRSSLQNEIKGRIIIYSGFLVASTLDGTIHILDRTNGEVLFTYKGEGEINAGLNIYKDIIIVPYRNGNIVAYDLQSRSEAWVFNAGGLISVRPVIRDGKIYFGSWDDTFYALDAQTGETLWSSYVGSTITRDFLVFEGEIVLFFTDGEMVCLHRNRGEIKWVKYFKGVEFNYNYFAGQNSIYMFIPDFIALDPSSGEMLFDYRERSFTLYKDMLFDNMVEGERPISEQERARLLTERYFMVSDFPYLPPARINGRYTYFLSDNNYLYIYDLDNDFYILKFRLP
jgi:outer membrane protein assembly factor BamB